MEMDSKLTINYSGVSYCSENISVKVRKKQNTYASFLETI